MARKSQYANEQLPVLAHFDNIYLPTDINECNGDNNCAQNCTDTTGSYECSCREGYNLTSDLINCEGKTHMGRVEIV